MQMIQIHSGLTAMSQDLTGRERLAASGDSSENLPEGSSPSQTQESYIPAQVMVPQKSRQASEMLSIASASGSESHTVNTPYQWLKNSRVGKLIRENKILSGVAALGASIVTAGGAAQSQGFAKIAEYGIVPAAAAGTALVGAALVHDGIVNDAGTSNLKAVTKISGGTIAALAGAQVVGSTYKIPVLDQALTWPVEKLCEYGGTVVGAGVAGGGVAAGVYAAKKLEEAVTDPEHRGRNAAIGVGSGLGSAAALLGGAELIGRDLEIAGLDKALTGTVQYLSKSPAAAVAGGALITAGAGVLASEAVENFKKGGNDLVTVAESMGSVTAGLGGIELAGHGLGIDAVKGLLTNNAATVGSVALSAGGAALLRMSVKDAKADGLGTGNSLGMTIGASMIPGGAAAALEVHGAHEAAEMALRGSGVVAGAGLGLTSFVLGRNSVKNLKNGKPGAAALYGAGSIAAGTGSLLTLGGSLKIEALKTAGEKLFENTLEPAFEHVIRPAAELLYNNPAAGAAVIAVGAGAYLFYRYHGKAKETGA